jgi:hypothetical protein
MSDKAPPTHPMELKKPFFAQEHAKNPTGEGDVSRLVFLFYLSLVLHSALHFNEAFVFELFEFPQTLISPPGPAGSGVYKNPGHMLSPIKADVHQVRRLFCARKFTSFAHHA